MSAAKNAAAACPAGARADVLDGKSVRARFAGCDSAAGALGGAAGLFVFLRRVGRFAETGKKTLDKPRGLWYTMRCRSVR